METSTTSVNSDAINIFPNPVTDKMVLTVNNTLEGNVKVEVVNMQGSVVKTVNLNKQAGSAQFYIAVSELPVGQYAVKVSMTNWTQSKIIIKQ